MTFESDDKIIIMIEGKPCSTWKEAIEFMRNCVANHDMDKFILTIQREDDDILFQSVGQLTTEMIVIRSEVKGTE